MSFSLHREAMPTLPISLLVLALLWVLCYAIHPLFGYTMVLPALILAVILIRFFRNPQVTSIEDPTQVLAPCDGKVVVIEQVQDELFFHGPVQQVSIFMSPLNVHVNRSPIAGQVRKTHYVPGKYLMAFNPKSSTLNERNYVYWQGEKLAVGCKQVAGFLARRIRSYVKEGDSSAQGGEYGFIKFGSRIDVLLPLDCPVQVELGQVVLAGKSVLALAPPKA